MRNRLVVSPNLYFAVYALCVPLALGVIANWASLQAMKDAPAWIQAVGSVAAIVAAAAVASHQTTVQQRRDQASDRAFVRGAVVAIEHAEAAISQAQRDLGGLRLIDRDHVAISPSLHMLEAVEATLGALPIDRAPTEEVARALMTARFHVRKVSGGIRAFLASDNSHARADYDDDENEITRAAVALRAEQRKCSGVR